MKRFQKTSLFFIAVLFIAISSLIYQRITPKTIGQVPFSLKKEWDLCVGEKILDISTDGNGMILIKTSNVLSAYNENDGSLLWTASIEGQRESFPPIIAENRVFVSDKNQLWSFDLKTGKELWKSVLTSADTWIPSASDKYVLLNLISDSIIVYDANTGTKLLEVPGGRGYTQAYLNDETVYIVDRGIKALDVVTENILWKLDNNRVTGLSTFGNGIIYYMEYPEGNTFDLVAYDTESKMELWRANFPDNSPNGLYLHSKFLVMTENEALYLIDSETGETKWKKVLSAPANLSFIGSNMYVLENFYRVIRTLNIEDGNELGSLQVAPWRIFGARAQEMISTETSLVFSRGCEIFVYGN